MDIKAFTGNTFVLLKKYRYVALILVIGLILMMIPAKDRNNTTPKASTSQKEEVNLEDKLTKILCAINGAGDVQVMLTVIAGEEIVYQTDDDISSSNDANNNHIGTVTITDANRNQTGLIRQIIPPVYQGAVVVCQGADNAAVRLAIVDAVSKVTGLGANQISVLKMK